MSQIFYLGPTLYFVLCRKSCLKNHQHIIISYPFFDIKSKLRPKEKKMRHIPSRGDVRSDTENILVQKIKVEK